LRPFECHAAAKPANHSKSGRSAVVAKVVGDPDIRLSFRNGASWKEQLEAGSEHADNFGTAPAGTDQLVTDHGGVSAIAPLPVFIAEDRNPAHRRERLIRLRRSIGRGKIAADGDLGTHHLEKVRGDLCFIDSLWRAVLPRNDYT